MGLFGSKEKVHEVTVEATPDEILAAAEDYMTFNGCKLIRKSSSELVFDKDLMSHSHAVLGAVAGGIIGGAIAGEVLRKGQAFLSVEPSLNKVTIKTNSKKLRNLFKE
jgi:hypothetical protein